MLDIVLDVDDNTLYLLTHSLQNLRVKDVQGKNMFSVLSYLKEIMVLLHKCTKFLTDLMCLLNNII